MHPARITENKLPNGATFNILLVEGGTFRLGSTEETPSQKLQLPSFYLAEHPVTQAVWQAVMGNNPSHFKGENRPVENVSWHDAQDFIEKLYQKTNRLYRLPSEAEWEYAARGGPDWETESFEYAGSDLLPQVGWFRENSGEETQEVGLLLPNAIGLYDMTGNVWEWCEDQYHSNFNGLPSDGSAWVDREEGAYRVLRGGGWSSYSRYCRVADRGNYEPADRNYDIGFRLALQAAG